MKTNEVNLVKDDANLEHYHAPLVTQNLAVRTFCIFLDLPRHIEYRIDGFPLLHPLDVVEFDLTLKNPRDLTKIRNINGPYFVSKVVLKYSSNYQRALGLSQYIEWLPCPPKPVKQPVNR